MASPRILSENYVFPEQRFTLISAGARFFSRTASLDLGAALPFRASDQTDFRVIPVLGLSWWW